MLWRMWFNRHRRLSQFVQGGIKPRPQLNHLRDSPAPTSPSPRASRRAAVATRPTLGAIRGAVAATSRGTCRASVQGGSSVPGTRHPTAPQSTNTTPARQASPLMHRLARQRGELHGYPSNATDNGRPTYVWPYSNCAAGQHGRAGPGRAPGTTTEAVSAEQTPHAGTVRPRCNAASRRVHHTDGLGPIANGPRLVGCWH